jgi:hypothetical protein
VIKNRMAVNRGRGHGKATKWIETGYSLYSRRGHWRTWRRCIDLGGILAWRYLFRRRRQNIRTSSNISNNDLIGSEVSGLPYAVWKALPDLFPEKFNGKDLSVFGFLYETDTNGNKRDLPIGLSRRTIQGIERAWFNCALCHTGTVRETADASQQIVPAMPSNNLDFHAFTAFVVAIADSPQLSPDKLIPAMKKAGANIDWLDEQVWRYIAIPRLGFYVPAALDPARNLFAAIFAVVCRFGGVAFFIHHRRSGNSISRSGTLLRHNLGDR